MPDIPEVPDRYAIPEEAEGGTQKQAAHSMKLCAACLAANTLFLFMLSPVRGGGCKYHIVNNLREFVKKKLKALNFQLTPSLLFGTQEIYCHQR